MMPPTSIDGTDITGATIDGTDVTEITVDGDTVFSAGPTIVDDFESGNLSAYSKTNASTSSSVDGTSPVFEGSFSFKTTDGLGHESFPGDGLNYYPEAGDKISWLAQPIGTDSSPYVALFVDPNLGTSNPIFAVEIQTRNNRFEIGFGSIAQEPSSWTSKWYLIEVDTDTSGNFRVVVYDGDSDTDPIKHDISGNEPSITSNRGIQLGDRRANARCAFDFITAEVGAGSP